MSKKMKNHVTR